MRNGFLIGLAIFLSGCGSFSSRSSSTKDAYIWLTRYDVKTLDPAAVQDWTTGTVLSYIYPSIGKLTDVSTTDNLVFTLKLKPAKFSDGSPVTPEDIVFTLKRCLFPEVQSGSGNQFAMQIAGANLIKNGSEAWEGVEILDSSTIRITLLNPDVSYKNKLNNWSFGVLNSKLVPLRKPLTESRKGFGAGSYTLDSFKTSEFWALTNGKDKLKFRYVADSATRRNLFDQGQADYAMFAPHEVGAVRGHKSLDKGGPKTLVYLQINPKTEPVLDRNQRILIRQNVNSSLFAGPLDGKVDPAPNMAALSFPFDSKIDQSKITPNTKELRITFADIGMQNPAVEAVVTRLREIGFNIRGRAMQSGAMLTANAKGDIPILFTGWQPDFEGPLNTFPMLFHSKSSENHSGFKNAEVDRLIDEASQGQEPNSRMKRVAEIIDRECPAIPLYIQRDLVLVKTSPPVP